MTSLVASRRLSDRYHSAAPYSRTPSLVRLFDGRPIALCRIDAAPSLRIRSSSPRTWRSLRSSTCAAGTIVIRPAAYLRQNLDPLQIALAHRYQSHLQSPRQPLEPGSVTF